MVTTGQIQELAEQIGRKFHPEKVILYGSYAHGVAKPDSDIDLFIIAEHTGKNWRLAAIIRQALSPIVAIDLLVRTPQQVQQRLEMNDPFIKDIIQKGQVLYENRHSGMD
jgi:predicted nucleotidyltransferase